MIKIKLAVLLAEKEIKSKDLAAKIGITEANLSILKKNKCKALRLETLNKICEALDCQPGEILTYEKD